MALNRNTPWVRETDETDPVKSIHSAPGQNHLKLLMGGGAVSGVCAEYYQADEGSEISPAQFPPEAGSVANHFLDIPVELFSPWRQRKGILKNIINRIRRHLKHTPIPDRLKIGRKEEDSKVCPPHYSDASS